MSQNESTDDDYTKKLLAGGKYDILMFTMGINDRDEAMRMKNFLRKIDIEDYELLNNYENFRPDIEVYVIFTKSGGSYEPFKLMDFGNFMIYDFFREEYPMFKKPSPIMSVDEFIDYVNKTSLLSAKMMYTPKKISRDI